MTMNQFTLTVIITICFLNSALGQKRTYFGLEFSVANDIYEITDNGDYLVNVPLINGQGGFNLRQEISRNLFVETGLILKYYWQGFGFKTIPYYGSTSDDPSWIIPVRLGLNLNLYKGKIYLVPVVGYSFGINPPYGYGLGYGKQTSSTTTIDYNYTENPDVSRYFSLLQTGIGFEFKLFNTLLLSITTNYYSGFKKTTHLDINYTVNNSNQTTGTAISKGEFWCVTSGLKYPISNFWTMKKKLGGQ
jgi:hypothetical protein